MVLGNHPITGQTLGCYNVVASALATGEGPARLMACTL
jgi:hypothetical protein